jgi:hypothetical protein
MILFVKTLGGKTITLDVDSDDSVEYIKQKINDTEGLQPWLQILVFSGKRLENNKSLSDYGIKNESTVHLLLRGDESRRGNKKRRSGNKKRRSGNKKRRGSKK